MTFFKKIRFFTHFFSAIINKHYKIILIGLFLGVLSFFFIPKIYKKLIPKQGKTFKIGLIGQYSANDIPLEILSQISYGLTTVSEKGEPLPGLAENWSIQDEGKTYIFKINSKNLFWHDGKEFLSKDISYNFKDIDFSVSGDSLIFRLKEPLSPLPVILSRPIFRNGLIGLGKYKIKQITSTGKFISSILLVPFEEKDLPNRLYRFYNNEYDLKTGFNLGEVSILENIFDTNKLYLGPAIKISQSVMENAYIGLFFNTNSASFANKSFRQALAYAISKETFPKRVLTPINPKSWSYNPDVKPYIQDLDHSQKLLEGEKIDSNYKITISTFPQFEGTANQVKEEWQKIGINSTVQIITSIPENFDVLIIAREIPNDPDQYYFWHSTQIGNLSNFKNFRLDKLLEDGRRISDKEQRKDIYFDFQRFLVEESPVVFLSHPTIYSVVRD